MEPIEMKSVSELVKKKSQDTLAEKILFGQFLISKGYITYTTLNEAVSLQEKEGYSTKIGEVLLKHFGVFVDQNDLDKTIEEFYVIRNSIIKERNNDKEKYTVQSVVDDVDYFLEQYTKALDLAILDKAILILESEREYRIGRNKTLK